MTGENGLFAFKTTANSNWNSMARRLPATQSCSPFVYRTKHRGTAKQCTKEGKYAVIWTRLSCRNFKGNQARPLLFALAQNLGNFLRPLAPPRPVKHWPLATLREKLIEIGAKVVRHSKYITFQVAEVAAPRELSAPILERIQRFGVPLPLLQRPWLSR